MKSVETRDWLGCVEPRAVRAVMKRVVEDLTAMDSRVGQLFEEGLRKDRSSDSSRRTPGIKDISRMELWFFFLVAQSLNAEMKLDAVKLRPSSLHTGSRF